MFIKHQISISEWYLKDDVTLKTGVMMLTIQLCHLKNKLHFKIYQIENILNHIISQYKILMYQNKWSKTDQRINAALVNIRYLSRFESKDSTLTIAASWLSLRPTLSTFRELALFILFKNKWVVKNTALFYIKCWELNSKKNIITQQLEELLPVSQLLSVSEQVSHCFVL